MIEDHEDVSRSRLAAKDVQFHAVEKDVVCGKTGRQQPDDRSAQLRAGTHSRRDRIQDSHSRVRLSGGAGLEA